LQIKTSTPEAIWKAKTLLGEGTLWVPSKSSIFFVDIKKKKILILNFKTNKKIGIRDPKKKSCMPVDKAASAPIIIK